MANLPAPFLVTQRAAIAGELAPRPMVLIGTLPSTALPAAASTAIGGVLKGATVADQAALTAVASAAAPTKAEFDAVVVDLAASRTKMNALLAQLRVVGII